MIDNIEPVAAVVALALIVAVWLCLGIRDRRRARRVDAAFVAALVERGAVQGLCPHLWIGSAGFWVVCSRPYEHTGPHVNHHAQDVDRS